MASLVEVHSLLWTQEWQSRTPEAEQRPGIGACKLEGCKGTCQLGLQPGGADGLELAARAAFVLKSQPGETFGDIELYLQEHLQTCLCLCSSRG